MFTELFGQKLSLAPIVDKKLHNVLDLATGIWDVGIISPGYADQEIGTGIWAIEFGRTLGDLACVIAADILQPRSTHRQRC